jgi:hypothetical protein
MKRLVIFLATTVFCGAMIACVSGENRAAEAPKPATVTVIEEPLVAPVSASEESPKIDHTAELKVQTYEAMKGYMEADFYNDNDFFDIAAFCKAVGCKCVLSSTLDEIIVEPIGYNDKETFQVAIKISPATQMVNGDVIRLGKIDENSWEDTEYHFSATDFTTGLVIDDYNVQIGFDELDYLWREIRLLTAPEDKFDEINAEIDAEIQSYYDIDIDHLNG